MMDEKAEKSVQNFDASSLIGTLFSNPDMLSKIGNIISKIGENESSTHSPQNINYLDNNADNNENNSNYSEQTNASSPTFQNIEHENIVSKLPDILSKITSLTTENSTENKQQIALLLAIRPYLSEHRKELIDTFIKMNRLGSIFKNLT